MLHIPLLDDGVVLDRSIHLNAELEPQGLLDVTRRQPTVHHLAAVEDLGDEIVADIHQQVFRVAEAD
jgi:hypothetical protein